MAAAPPVAAEPPLPALDVAPPLPGTGTAPPEPTAVVPPEPLAPGPWLSLPEQAAAAMTTVSATIGARDASETEPARGDATDVIERPAPLRDVGGIVLDAG